MRNIRARYVAWPDSGVSRGPEPGDLGEDPEICKIPRDVVGEGQSRGTTTEPAQPTFHVS